MWASRRQGVGGNRRRPRRRADRDFAGGHLRSQPTARWVTAGALVDHQLVRTWWRIAPDMQRARVQNAAVIDQIEIVKRHHDGSYCRAVGVRCASSGLKHERCGALVDVRVHRTIRLTAGKRSDRRAGFEAEVVLRGNHLPAGCAQRYGECCRLPWQPVHWSNFQPDRARHWRGRERRRAGRRNRGDCGCCPGGGWRARRGRWCVRRLAAAAADAVDRNREWLSPIAAAVPLTSSPRSTTDSVPDAKFAT